MGIIIIIDNFQTLANVAIANLIRTNLVQSALTTITHVTTVVAQEKTRSYKEQVLGNDFIPFAIETYGCLHFHFDSFLISCVHANIVRHQHTSLIPSMLISYYKQRMLIAFRY